MSGDSCHSLWLAAALGVSGQGIHWPTHQSVPWAVQTGSLAELLLSQGGKPGSYTLGGGSTGSEVRQPRAQGAAPSGTLAFQHQIELQEGVGVLA